VIGRGVSTTEDDDTKKLSLKIFRDLSEATISLQSEAINSNSRVVIFSHFEL